MRMTEEQKIEIMGKMDTLTKLSMLVDKEWAEMQGGYMFSEWLKTTMSKDEYNELVDMYNNEMEPLIMQVVVNEAERVMKKGEDA